MAILVKGVDFTTGQQVTATNLDNLVDSATFATGAVDNSTTQLSGGAIIVKDGGITSSKLDTNITVAGTLTVGGDILALTGAIAAGTSSREILIRTLLGLNRIDSYDNPITGTVPLIINSSNLSLQIADATKAELTSTGLAITGDVSVSTKTPASASATGVTGTISWDSNYLYVCTATNTWKRVAIATW